MRARLVSLVLAVSLAGIAAGDPSSHLLAGVQAFQSGHYDEALVELRLVERSARPPADLAFYLGPTLYKLGRASEALVVFRRSTVPPDTLTELYLGLTLYQLALYDQARTAFASAAARGLGPRLDAAARRYIAVIDQLFATPPGTRTIDAYLDAGLRLLARGERELAEAYLQEAARAEQRGNPHRHEEIVELLARTRLAP